MKKLIVLALILSVSSSAFALDTDTFCAAETLSATDFPVEAPVDVEGDPIGVAGELLKAAKEGNWRLFAALLLTVCMVVLSRVREKVKWFKGDRGGSVLVMALAMAGAVATALMTDAKMDWKLFVGAAGVAWTAAGGYTWAKRLISPKDKKEDDKESE